VRNPSIIRSHSPHNGGIKQLWNVGLLQRDYTAQYLRSLSSSHSSLWENGISVSRLSFEQIILPARLLTLLCTSFWRPYGTVRCVRTKIRHSLTLPRWLQSYTLNDVTQKWSIIGKAIWFTYFTNPSFYYQQNKKSSGNGKKVICLSRIAPSHTSAVRVIMFTSHNNRRLEERRGRLKQVIFHILHWPLCRRLSNIWTVIT
jgi:hypothetical protein